VPSESRSCEALNMMYRMLKDPISRWTKKSLPRLCNWHSCKPVTLWHNSRFAKPSTDVHVAAILKGWPGSCSRPRCSSNIFFKASKRLESHVYNIHKTHLCCTVAGCEDKRPVGILITFTLHSQSFILRIPQIIMSSPLRPITSFPKCS
jgi:hypothetical protein